ncbi:thiol reductant ABC exporter subunit CydD [Brachybacterium alimentarium]|uniref:Thiol reductant ABC exporter subunit CydD n=1 Tax=Brachybacterium alimentarium TaxID=47845 RepID=A0A2A3YIB4_9MICO|nr:thiol reductant ABC exporter subunit CydD [Brachybacterium alimentarium]PCC38969.1 thiol reductant ABC exporter subunit CydD [Brachybacterium alimentarium]RCS71983.1 thiol reductant ABC exporter subunit CydD [Brachybacterium alimentarium]RCS77523.1 thiol reductant ABC exporter subunit CydD [Brachybacterium alimentarium]RCS78303.1 thiol reductant ABC exporter subunit CydD [Brachybacterium alimentarium]RCS91015.1 thiol reductant ABC exporter subunit CydD [Brachybacterium alimentarium]
MPRERRARRARRAPLDPRLVREVRAARHHVMRTVALGLVQSLCVIVTALSVARLGAQLLTEQRLPQDAPLLLTALLAALAVRAGAVLLEQRTAHHAATAAIGDLRGRLVAHAAALGPRRSAGRGADLTSLATTGVERLRPYLVGYVPQLMLSLTVTPLCLLTIGILDPLSAVIALITLPLVPLFMILVGTMTVGRSEALLADMRTLWSQLLDLVDGLPTLRALGRERGPEKMVRELGDRHRISAMGSLKFAFLSSMVLELLATLCVALVAVSIGMRLVYGEMDLAPALAVLVLAPEIYLPLRNVGSQYHSSTDGLAAVTAAFEVLDEQPLPDGSVSCPDLSTATLALRGVSVRSREGHAPHAAELVLRPGRVLALVGPSGAGKTTAVQVLLGLLEADDGRAEVRGPDGVVTDVRELSRRSYWDQVALLPQRPVLPPGSLRTVLSAVRPEATLEELEQVAASTGLDAVIAARGWDAELGRAGRGLSLGERQRLSLARALLSPAQLVVLDEPTAHLDGATETIVLDLLRTLRAQGRTVLVIAHRSRLVEVADDVARVDSRSLVEDRPEVPA